MQSKKQDEWCKRIEEWKQSGLNQAGYCRDHNGSLATFGYWKRKMKRPTTQLLFLPIERRLKRDKADVQEVVTTRRDEARMILDQRKPWLEE